MNQRIFLYTNMRQKAYAFIDDKHEKCYHEGVGSIKKTEYRS